MISHTHSNAARAKGLAPACLNFLKDVSAPNAVIAMVSRKVEMMFIVLANGAIKSEGKYATIKLFTPIISRKRNANHGMVIFERCVVCLLLPNAHDRMRRTKTRERGGRTRRWTWWSWARGSNSGRTR